MAAFSTIALIGLAAGAGAFGAKKLVDKIGRKDDKSAADLVAAPGPTTPENTVAAPPPASQATSDATRRALEAAAKRRRQAAGGGPRPIEESFLGQTRTITAPKTLIGSY